jgi:hypothetical protein
MGISNWTPSIVPKKDDQEATDVKSCSLAKSSGSIFGDGARRP